jgi:hypothetical protein
LPQRRLLKRAAAPAAAQDNPSKSVDPHELTVKLKKPPLKLDDAQHQAALAEERTQQKTPKDFKPQVGTVAPKGIKIDVSRRFDVKCRS